MRRRDQSLAFSSRFLEEEGHDAKHYRQTVGDSDQVIVTGTLVKKGGVQMIYIESVK